MKWIKFIIGGLLALILVLVLFVGISSQIRWVRGYQNFEVNITPIDIPTGPEAVQRGEHIAVTHYCGYCHSGNLSGAYLINDPRVAVVQAPNLTPGAGGIGAVYTDEDWTRAIRHGVGKDGRALLGMPASIWYNLNDEDLGALIAYLKTLQPIDNPTPPRTIGPLGRVLLSIGQFPKPDAMVIDHAANRPAPIEPGASVEYGRYLVFSACSACHGKLLNGGSIRGLEGDLDIVPNLTPGGELANWTETDFVSTLRTGEKPNGQSLSPTMPWYYVGQMTDEELQAVWLYLQSLPAREQNTTRTDVNN